MMTYIISYHIIYRKRLEKLEERIALNETSPITGLRGVTCHMGSHSDTCHPTQVNAPNVKPSQLVLDLPTLGDGRLS